MRQGNDWILRVPIFQIKLPIIAEIDPEGLLTLEVELEAQDDLNLSRDEHMSFDQELWKNITTNRKVRLQVDEGLGSRWIQQFLETAPNADEIRLDALVYKDAVEPNRIGRFASLTVLTSWPDLRWLTLYDMILDRDTLVGILRVHRSILMTIKISCLGFHYGTWHEPTGCLTTMTKLHRISLNNLLEEHPYSEVEGPTDENQNPTDLYEDSGPLLRVGSGAPLDSMKEIPNTLLGNFHTYKGYAVVHDSTKTFSH